MTVGRELLSEEGLRIVSENEATLGAARKHGDHLVRADQS